MPVAAMLPAQSSCCELDRVGQGTAGACSTAAQYSHARRQGRGEGVLSVALQGLHSLCAVACRVGCRIQLGW